MEKPKEKGNEETICSADIEQNQLISSKPSYEYKRPLPEEYEQAIVLYAHCHTSVTGNEWNLRDFYRDVKTQLEPDSNSKAIFEKCLKLSRYSNHHYFFLNIHFF